jgi:hypothetical protein
LKRSAAGHRLLLDGTALSGTTVPLVDDGHEHTVEMEL